MAGRIRRGNKRVRAGGGRTRKQDCCCCCAGFTYEATANTWEYDFFGPAVCSAADVLSWAWDFGDGGTSTSQNPTHQFTAPGPYVVRLTVVIDNEAEATCYTEQTIVIHCEATTGAEIMDYLEDNNFRARIVIPGDSVIAQPACEGRCPQAGTYTLPLFDSSPTELVWRDDFAMSVCGHDFTIRTTLTFSSTTGPSITIQSLVVSAATRMRYIGPLPGDCDEFIKGPVLFYPADVDGSMPFCYTEFGEGSPAEVSFVP